MCSCPRSVSPGDTGAPPAQPSEVVPPAPGLAVIATPDRVTTLRSWELLMGSVRGSAGHPAAAVAPGTARATIPVGARCHPSTPNPAANYSTPHAAAIPRPPAPGRGASGSGQIPWRLSWGTPAPLQGSESLSKPGWDAEPQIGEIQPQSGGARPPPSLQSLGGCSSIPGLRQSPFPKFTLSSAKVPWSSFGSHQGTVPELTPCHCHPGAATLVPLTLLSPSQPLRSVPAPGWGLGSAGKMGILLTFPSSHPVRHRHGLGGCASPATPGVSRATSPCHSCAPAELHGVTPRELFPSLSDKLTFPLHFPRCRSGSGLAVP